MKSLKILAVAMASTITLTLAACSPEKPIPKVTEFSYEPQVIAVVGDFGVGDKHEKAVAKMVASQNPDFVVTLGDNVYKKKGYAKLVGKYYPQPLVPATGNHDYLMKIAKFDRYFGTTAETRSYVYRSESGVDFFILDSEAGLRSLEKRQQQWQWLVREVSRSKANFKVVVLHHPPYSSSKKHGSTLEYQWMYRSMGVDLVLSGHDHTYERIIKDDLTYVVDGTGGAPLYKCRKNVIEGSLGCDGKHFGALFLYASKYQLRAVFRGTKGQVLDTFTLEPNR